MDFERNASVSLHTSVAVGALVLEEQPTASSAAVGPGDLTALLATLEHERIAALAYFYWQQRGCPEGSPDDDWFAAQQHIRDSR